MGFISSAFSGPVGMPNKYPGVAHTPGFCSQRVIVSGGDGVSYPFPWEKRVDGATGRTAGQKPLWLADGLRASQS